MMLRVNQLSGFGGRRASLTSVSFISASQANDVTCPAVEPGDLIVSLELAVNLGTTIPTTGLPPGFTSIVNNGISGGGSPRVIASYKIADGTEDGSNLSGMDGSLTDEQIVLVFRGNVPIQNVTASTPNSQSLNGNPTAQTVLAASGTAPLVVFGDYSSSGAIDPRGFSPTKDGEQGAGGFYFAYKIYNTTPADVIVDMDDEGDANILQSFYLQLS